MAFSNAERLMRVGMAGPLALVLQEMIESGPGPVQSVNGDTGVVVLTASDVGAAAEDVLDGQSDVTITYTTGDPEYTPTGSFTVANGATPTVSELLRLVLELNAKVDAIISALD